MKAIVLVTGGRGGSDFFQGLLDNHEEILQIPAILRINKEFIEIVNFFQKYSIGTLESREVYRWYCDVLPRGKRFNKYIKGKKSKKYDKDLTKILINHFECSKLHAHEYIELISKEELKEILEMYGNDKKTIKRLCK